MILFYLLAAVAALIGYAVTFRLGVPIRIMIALLIFIIPSVSLTILVFIVGDKAPPDAITVYPNGDKVPADAMSVYPNRKKKE
jgi:hypothetical protein